MVLSPHIEENRLHIRAARDGLDHRLALPPGQLGSNSRRKLSGILFREILKKDDRQVRRLRLWGTGVLLDPVRHFGLMRLRPISNVLSMRWIGTHPRLRELIMVVR